MRNANAKLVASRVCNALFLALGNQETQGHADRPILWAFSYLGNGAIGKFFARKLAVTAKNSPNQLASDLRRTCHDRLTKHPTPR